MKIYGTSTCSKCGLTVHYRRVGTTAGGAPLYGWATARARSRMIKGRRVRLSPIDCHIGTGISFHDATWDQPLPGMP